LPAARLLACCVCLHRPLLRVTGETQPSWWWRARSSSPHPHPPGQDKASLLASPAFTLLAGSRPTPQARCMQSPSRRWALADEWVAWCVLLICKKQTAHEPPPQTRGVAANQCRLCQTGRLLAQTGPPTHTPSAPTPGWPALLTHPWDGRRAGGPPRPPSWQPAQPDRPGEEGDAACWVLSTTGTTDSRLCAAYPPASGGRVVL